MSYISVELHDSRPLSWWANEEARGRMEMSPPYQRRSNLWGRWKKAHLIDSIINGFDIPKFYVADFTRGPSALNQSKKPYAVIDGKQRFEAIFSYLDDEFPLNPTSTYQADPDINIANLTYTELRNKYPKIAKDLQNFVPVVMSVASDSQQLIEQLFVRLNSGVAINGAERRNAMPGPVPPMVRDITVHPFFGDRVRFSKDRMQEFNLAAKLLMFEFDESLGDSKARNLDQFVNHAYQSTVDIVKARDTANAKRSVREAQRLDGELEEKVAPYQLAEERVLLTLDRMTNIFSTKDPLLKKQDEIPVYYWVIRNSAHAGREFRDFLAQFEPSVMDNMRLSRIAPDQADPELLNYYSHLRTSNDKASLQARYEMLRGRFDTWKQDLALQTTFQLN
jgi:hypothetical protein